jgi:hypothetical protein
LGEKGFQFIEPPIGCGLAPFGLSPGIQVNIFCWKISRNSRIFRNFRIFQEFSGISGYFKNFPGFPEIQEFSGISGNFKNFPEFPKIFLKDSMKISKALKFFKNYAKSSNIFQRQRHKKLVHSGRSLH